MDPYRPPASLDAISRMMLEQHAARMLTEQRQYELQNAKRFLVGKFLRACFYLLGGGVATLIVNRGFPMPLPVIVGACAAIALGMCWFMMGVNTYSRFGPGPALAVRSLSAWLHVGVLVWTWIVAGPEVAVPWFFVQMGLAGVISSIARFSKLP